MKNLAPTDYFFIHYLESESPVVEDKDCAILHYSGSLYIGHAEWTENHTPTNNTFFSLEDAREALRKIKDALKSSKHLPIGLQNSKLDTRFR